MLIERGRKRSVRKGTRVLVIGSRGADVFYAARSTRTYGADCVNKRPKALTAYLLSAKSAAQFRRVGTPVIALRLKKGARYDTTGAGFKALPNAVNEDTYKKLLEQVQTVIMEDLQSGAFEIKPDDKRGFLLARNPNPEQIQIKFDFGTPIRYRGLDAPFLLVEGAQVFSSYRRCLRLFDGRNPIGQCAPMPHELMVETRQLNFVSYDPTRRGRPFVFAFTKGETLWGDERWGFQITDTGPKLFLRDALDPRCRSHF